MFTTAQDPGPPDGRWNPWQGPQRKGCLGGDSRVTVRTETGRRFIPSCPLQTFASTSHWLKSPRDQETRAPGQCNSSDSKLSWTWQGLHWADWEDCLSNGRFREQAHRCWTLWLSCRKHNRFNILRRHGTKFPGFFLSWQKFKAF